MQRTDRTPAHKRPETKPQKTKETTRTVSHSECLDPNGRIGSAPAEKAQAGGPLILISNTSRRAQRRSEASQNVLCQAFFQESGLTAGKICTKMRFTATAGNSTPNTGVQRESGWCKLSRDAEGRPPACRGQEMARRLPAVIGTRVRISQMRIQVEPRTKLFVRPEPFGLGASFYALSQTILMKKEFGT